MIVGKRFPGDNNNVLMMIQHDNYVGPRGVCLLCAEAELRYSAAIHLLSVTTELWDAIKRHDEKFYSAKGRGERAELVRLLNVVGTTRAPLRRTKKREHKLFIRCFDHRVLQGAYGTIAAAFRFDNPDLWLPLFSEDEAVKEITLSAWEKFWEAEVKRLVQNDRIAIAVLTAVAFQNEETGLAAEEELAELLRFEYKGLSKAMNGDTDSCLG